MKKKTKQSISAALACAALTSFLTPAAYAEELTSEDVQTQPAAVQSDTDPVNTPAAENGKTGTLTESVSGESISENAEGEEAALQSPANNAAEEEENLSAQSEEPAAAEAVLKVANVTLGDTADDSGWDASTCSGWRYDASSVSLVNNSTAVEIHAENSGVNLSVAGLNRVSTLYADDTVNITGTGILLVDNIDMLEGTQLNLLTNTDMYSEGSVALFVRNADDGKYYLANGTVTGILDEDYTLPEGVELVVPEGGQLNMHVTDDVVKLTLDGSGQLVNTEHLHYGIEDAEQQTLDQAYDEESANSIQLTTSTGSSSDVIQYENTDAITCPKLTISSGSILTIEKGANLLMDTTDYLKAQYHHYNDTVQLIVQGILNLWGTITGTRETQLIPEVDVEAVTNTETGITSAGSIQGDGTLSDVNIFYKNLPETEDVIHVNGDNILAVTGVGPTLDVQSGSSEVYVRSDASLNGLIINDTEDTSVKFTTKDELGTVNLNSDPGSVLEYVDAPYNTIFVNGFLYWQEADSVQKDISSRTADGQWNVSAAEEVYVRIVASSRSKIPEVTNTSTQWSRGSITLQSEILTYNRLQELLPPTTTDSEWYISCYRVIVLHDGKQEAVLITKDSNQTVSAIDVCEIDLVHEALACDVWPASGISVTTANSTGAGILGGTNAGSFTGGGSTNILTGSRKNTSKSSPSSSDSGSSSSDSGSSSADSDTTPADSDTTPADSDTTPVDPDTNPSEQEPSAEDPDTPAEEEAHSSGADSGWYIAVTNTGNGYHLDVYNGIRFLNSLGGNSIAVTFNVQLPDTASGKDLFAVFTGADGQLKVFRAVYNAKEDTVTFDSTELGDFVLVSLDWAGDDLTSPEFLSAIRAAMAG